MEELKKILKDLGLSSYKIETYVSLLRIRKGTIQQIAKHSKVPSCKLYENLKWLYERGYITLVLEKPLTYQANNPKTILESEIKRREETMEKTLKELEKIDLYFPESENLVQIANSEEAFFKKMKESVKESKESISYTVRSWKTDAELLNLFKEKNRKGVKIRCLGPMSKENSENIRWLQKSGVQIRDCIPKTTRFSIFDKKITIIRMRKNEDEYYSIRINSEVLAEILEDYFDILWKSAKKEKL